MSQFLVIINLFHFSTPAQNANSLTMKIKSSIIVTVVEFAALGAGTSFSIAKNVTCVFLSSFLTNIRYVLKKKTLALYFCTLSLIIFTFFPQCVENVSRGNCPVCLEDIHTSRMPCHIPDCGHLLHRNCFEELLTFGHYACPICQTSLLDMSKVNFFSPSLL